MVLSIYGVATSVPPVAKRKHMVRAKQEYSVAPPRRKPGGLQRIGACVGLVSSPMTVGGAADLAAPVVTTVVSANWAATAR